MLPPACPPPSINQGDVLFLCTKNSILRQKLGIPRLDHKQTLLRAGPQSSLRSHQKKVWDFSLESKKMDDPVPVFNCQQDTYITASSTAKSMNTREAEVEKM